MFCTACGTKNAAESNFCRQCGGKLEKTPPKISEEEFDRALPAEEQLSALLERAYRLRKSGDLPAAVALCEEALRLKPDSTSAHSLRAQLYELSGEREQALREYERVLQLNPGSIADRVKRDELRGDTRPAAPLADTRPTVVLAEPANLRSSGRMLLLAGLTGAALMAVVVVSALQLQGRSTATADVRSGGWAPASGFSTAKPASNAPPASSAAVKPGAPNINKEIPATHWAYQAVVDKKGATAHEAVPNTAMRAAPPNALPPGVYYVPTQTRAVSAPIESPPHTKTRPTRPTAVSAATVARNNDADVQGSNRVVLPGDDDGVTRSGDGKYVIKISAPKSAVTSGGTPKNDTGKAGKKDYVAVIRTARPDVGNPPPSHTDAGNAPSSDAQGYIAMGDEAKLKEQYTKAVASYRRALPTAGDEAGFVNQQIAWCYQRMGNTVSAKTFYQGAIAEYHKLESAGRLTETGRAGLRFCEQGIKTCDSL